MGAEGQGAVPDSSACSFECIKLNMLLRRNRQRVTMWFVLIIKTQSNDAFIDKTRCFLWYNKQNRNMSILRSSAFLHHPLTAHYTAESPWPLAIAYPMQEWTRKSRLVPEPFLKGGKSYFTKLQRSVRGSFVVRASKRACFTKLIQWVLVTVSYSLCKSFSCG